MIGQSLERFLKAAGYTTLVVLAFVHSRPPAEVLGECMILTGVLLGSWLWASKIREKSTTTPGAGKSRRAPRSR